VVRHHSAVLSQRMIALSGSLSTKLLGSANVLRVSAQMERGWGVICLK
jgi:hypothetical protein